MSDDNFHIATLHRGKYMLLLLIGVCVVTALVSRLPLQETVKIITVLLSLPFLLFASVKWSNNNSVWTVKDGEVEIEFSSRVKERFSLREVKYLRNLPRSGGNLIMIYLHEQRKPKRYWRNKLFQRDDDLNALIHALRQQGIEYYYM